MEVRRISFIYVSIQRNKILGINLTKKLKDPYTANYETLLKGVKDTKKWENIPY